MTRLSIAVLGGLHIHPDGAGARLDLPTRKSKAMLAYLALSPGMLRSREHLAGTFWDRSAEEQARASLRQTLSSVRRTMSSAPALINSDSESVWLDTQAVEVDALQFERLALERSAHSLEKAAALYRGELLGGFSLREEGFEQWMSAERRRFHELAVQAFSELVDHYTRADKVDRGIAIAEKLLALDPLLESAHRSLIRLYSRSGRREAALRQYQHCTRILSEQLGIAPAEETRRLAAEIGREPSARSGADSAAVQPITQRAPEPDVSILTPDNRESEPALLSPERKQLTVLCSRIRELIESSDPETALERDPLLGAMVDAVRHFGGTMSEVRGDGVTALFGAPLAHEDHAVGACYAALAMREAIASRAPQLDMRIGIHSGEAVVRLIGGERERRYEAIGPVSRLASCIDAVLAPGQIGLTGDTARRAEGFVELAPPEAKRVEGVTEPVQLFTLRAKAALRLRWEARSARELTRFVGREAETRRLRELLERAASGSGQVAAIVGEPGMGKSRLVHEFINSRATDWMVLETGTISHDTRATYLPIANLLRTWFKIGERDAQAEAAEKLRDGVTALDSALTPLLTPLAALLDLLPADLHWSTLTPQQRRQRTLEAVTTLVVRGSQARPLILVVEDLHWSDAGTQAVLDYLVDRIAGSRILLLVTHRPEYRHEWFTKSYFSGLRVDALAADNADRLLRALLGDDARLVDLRKQLIERTGGTPLFLEESVRALADAGVLEGSSGAYRTAGPVEISQIPSTVHAVIAARIDRLPAMQKSLLQTAAVIGKEVPAELLQPVAGFDPEPLNELLAELQGAEFLYQTRFLPEPQYTFKHALTHQVAYESLLRERRRAIHLQLIAISETLYADRLEEHVEHLAHHALASEQWTKAVDYLYRSASKAMQRSAHQPAIQFLNKGLEIIATLPESPERLRQELNYRKAMGVTMMAAKGWAAQEVLDAYTRARVLCEELGDKREMFIVLRGEGQYRMIHGDSQIARKLGDRCVELAAGSKDMGVHIETHHLFWTNSFFMGEYTDADFHCGKGISLYEKSRDHALTYVYSGHDPGVCCRSFSALIQCLYGYPDRALETCRDALDLAREFEHPLTTGVAQWAYSFAHILRREPGQARDWAEREVAVAEQYLLPLLVSQATFQLGWALAELGDLDGGIARMGDGIAAISATSAGMGLPYFLALLGETLGKAGKPDAGLVEIDRALSTAHERSQNFQLSEILRVKGVLLAMLSKSRLREAEACFRKAIDVAETQGAKLPKLQATMSLARLLAGTGDKKQARALLQPTYDSITEGRDLPDLRSAGALLAELR